MASSYDISGVWLPPEWSFRLRGLYWKLRYQRKCRWSKARLIYRLIRQERLALVDAGVNPEYVRLVCLYLADPKREARVMRVVAFERRLGVLSVCRSGGMGAEAPHKDAALGLQA